MRNRRKGYTLVELLVPVAILAIIAAMGLVVWGVASHVEPAVYRSTYLNKAYVVADNLGNQDGQRDREDEAIICEGVGVLPDTPMDQISGRQLKAWVKDQE